MKRILTKATCLILLSAFFTDACCYGLAPISSQHSPIIKSRIFSDLQRPQSYASKPDLISKAMIIKFLNEQAMGLDRIHPDAYQVLLDEALALNTNNLEWILRGIFGKASQDSLTKEEIKLFIERAEIEPTIMLYSPVLSPDNVLHPDRLKKDVPIKGGIRIYSPTVGEAIISNIVNDLQNILDLQNIIEKYRASERRLSILGKYSGGLIPGLLIAQKLQLPFDTITKRPFVFEVSGQDVIQIEEPHLPVSSPEYYSHMVAYRDSGVIIVDDEATKGDVLINTISALEGLNVSAESSIVILQSTDAVGDRMSKIGHNYYAMQSINSNQDANLSHPQYLSLGRFKVVPAQRYFDDSSIDYTDIPIIAHPIKKGTSSSKVVFVDHPFRGMGMPLSPQLYASVASRIKEEIKNMVGDIGQIRKHYYKKDRTCYLLGLTPSGLYPALAASESTRIPLIGVTNQSEPKGYRTNIIEYITLDGYSYSLYGLEKGDGIILITGELTDGEEQLRVIKSLKDEGVDVLGLVSVLENTYYDGRKRIEQYAGINARSLQRHSHNEGIKIINRSESVWDALKYAVNKLNRQIRCFNSEARVIKIETMPSSLTRGLMLLQSDIDNMFVYVSGISQMELDNISDEFAKWLNTGDILLSGSNEEMPKLISIDHVRSAEAKYEIHNIPRVVIYENGKFRSRQEIAEESGSKLAMFKYEKNSARIRLLLMLGELDPLIVKALLKSENPEGYYYKSVMESLCSDAILSESAKNLALELDKLYANQKTLYIIKKGCETEFKNALTELCEKDLVRICKGKVIPLWRLNSIRWTRRFWERQIEILAESLPREHTVDILNKIQEKTRFSIHIETEKNQLLKGAYPENPIILETILQQMLKQKEALEELMPVVIEMLDFPSVFVEVALRNLILTNRAISYPILKKRLSEMIHTEEINDTFGSQQKKIHIMLNIIFDYCYIDPFLTDEVVRFVYEDLFTSIEKRAISDRLPSILIQEIILHMGKAFDNILNKDLKDNIYQFIRSACGSYANRTRKHGNKALQYIKTKQSDNIKRINGKENMIEAFYRDREKLFSEIERRRVMGDPILSIVSDYDETLLRFVPGENRTLSPAISFWLNWLMENGIQVTIVTGSTYQRIFDTALCNNLLIPLSKTPNLSIITENCLYHNDRPVKYTEIPKLDMQNIFSFLYKDGWREIPDRKRPGLMFAKFEIDKQEAEKAARNLKEYLKRLGIDYDITITQLSRQGDFWAIRVYNRDKSVVFSPGDLTKYGFPKINPAISLILFDDGGEFGVDRSLVQSGDRALLVNVGQNIDVGLGIFQLETKNEEGSILAIEALAASVIKGVLSDGKIFDWDSLVFGIKQSANSFDRKEIEDIIAPVRKLVRSTTLPSRNDSDGINNEMKPAIDIIEIYPTNCCMLECRGCPFMFRHDRWQESDTLPIEAVDKVRNYHPKQIRIVGGGEPTLYRYKENKFSDLVSRLRIAAPSAEIGLCTNGVFIPPGNWQKEISWVAIQLYGTSQEDFYQYTGKDKFDMVMSNIFNEYYANSSIATVFVNFYYSKENILKLPLLVEEIWQMWKEVCSNSMGLPTIKSFLLNVHPCADDKNAKDPFGSSNLTEAEHKQYENALKLIEKNQPALWDFIQKYAPSMLIRPFETHVAPPAKKCPMASNSVVLGADQNFYPCFIMANVTREYNFGSINELSPETLLELRRQYYNNPINRCKESCHPGATYTGKYIKRAGIPDMKNIAITGVLGDIGSNFARYLINKKHNVMGLVRHEPVLFEEKDSYANSEHYARKKGEILSKKSIEELLHNNDILYHFAAVVGQDIDYASQAYVLAVNAFGAALLARIAKKNNVPPAIVYASSQRCYGIEDNPEVIEWMNKVTSGFDQKINDILLLTDEEIKEALISFSASMLEQYPLPKGVNIYDISKLLGEKFLESLPNVVCVRISNVYGPGCHSGRIMQRIIEGRFTGRQIIEEQEERDYIYIHDLTKILFEIGREKILDTIDSKAKIIDVASGEKVSMQNVWNIIEKFTPDQKGQLEIIASSRTSASQSNSYAVRLLGRPFCSIATGIRNAIDDYRYQQKTDSQLTSGTIVFDIGGTSIRTGIFYADGTLEIIKRETAPNYNTYQDATIEVLQKKLIDYIQVMVEEARGVVRSRGAEIKLERIAVSFPGPVENFSTINRAPTLWGTNSGRLNLAYALKQNTKNIKEVYIIHDISADAIRYAFEKEEDRFCVVTISSGISCRIYDKNKGGLITDENDFAGEIGHLIVDYSEGAPLCECGEKGHLNAVGSGRAAEKILREKARQDATGFRQSLLYEYTEGDFSKIDNMLFAQAVSKQDEWALSMIKQLAVPIAYAINNISVVYGVKDFYLIGGFAIAHGDIYLNAILENLRKIRLLDRPEDYFDGHITLGYSDDADGLRGAGYFAQSQNMNIEVTAGKMLELPHFKNSISGDDKKFIEVSAPTEISYRNYFTKGIFEADNSILAELCNGRKALMIVDSAVYEKWRDKIDKYIGMHDLDCTVLSLPGGEAAKDMSYVELICTRASELGLDRKGSIIAVGGGAIMDVAGLSAQLYRRGIDYIRIPTTLLGIVDAAVGVKVGIDYNGSKNFLGAFYPPKYVISDTGFLRTLPEREMRSGIAEIIKVAIISNSELFETLEQHGQQLIKNIEFKGYNQFVEDAAVELLQHLQKDFYEHDLMRHVDFGHTMAHYFESISNYELTHGEAVAIDILISAHIAKDRGILAGKDLERVVLLYKKLQLPFYHKTINLETMWNAVQKAISHKGGRLMMVVPKKIGQTVFIDSLSKEELNKALEFVKNLDHENKHGTGLQDAAGQMLVRESRVDVPIEQLKMCLSNSRSEFPDGVIDNVIEILETETKDGIWISNIKQEYPDNIKFAERRIVLTGGIYGGKTTFLRRIAPHYSKDTVYLPEVIPLLLEGGIKVNPESYTEQINIQRLIYILKYLIEVETSLLYPDAVVLCERGTLDGIAWWPGKPMDFEKEFGGIRNELNRYGHVIFSESVASTDHAVGELKKRYESIERAKEIDSTLHILWSAHKSFYKVLHTDWATKAAKLEITLATLHARVVGQIKSVKILTEESANSYRINKHLYAAA
jgi:3-dehydroquinate synthetase/nucleoside-diphosphate-sugar epimerase/predicted NBD/HSP70 family sugar kinase/MoaA/NifB/PqqE/SkfB family radical SAM enzyme/adenine/guanine phosphoribosyltransferase-like PRPP-binding protein